MAQDLNLKGPEGDLRDVGDLDPELMVLKGCGRGDNKDWALCRRAPRAEIEGLPQSRLVVRPQVLGSGIAEKLGHMHPHLRPAAKRILEKFGNNRMRRGLTELCGRTGSCIP
jgi:hypothetical protein